MLEGGLTLKFRDLFGLEAVVRNLVTIGMVATWLITAWGTRLVTGLTYAELASQLALGGQIKATSITKALSLEKLLSFHKGKVSLLFAMDPEKRLHWFTQVRQPEPKPGWQIGSILKADSAEPGARKTGGSEIFKGNVVRKSKIHD